MKRIIAIAILMGLVSVEAEARTRRRVTSPTPTPAPAPAPAPAPSGFSLTPSTMSLGGTLQISGQIQAPVSLPDVSICYGFTADNNHQFGDCRSIGSIYSGQMLNAAFSRSTAGLADAVLGGNGYALHIALFQNNPWTQISRVETGLRLTFAGGSSPSPSPSPAPAPAPAPAPVPAPAPMPSPAPNAGLLFSDEFDTLDIASNSNPNGFWRPNDYWQDINKGYIDFAGTSFNISPNDPAFAGYSPFSVQNGILTIKAFRTPDSLRAAIQRTTGGTIPNWCGGMLIQNPALRRWKYGYVEIRARFPVQGKGMFPAIWFYNSDPNRPEKGGAEMDLLEIFGTPNYFFSGVHLRDNTQAGRGISLYESPIDASAFHTYAIDWQPNYYRIYVDGVLRKELTGPDAQWFDTTMGIRLNYAMEAAWFSQKSDASTPSTLTMEVDYVRVYGQKP